MADRTIRVGIDADIANARQDLDELFQRAIQGSQQARREINSALGGNLKVVTFFDTDIDTGKVVQKSREVLSEWDKIEKQISKASKTEAGSLTNLRQRLNLLKQQRDSTAKYVLEIDRTGQAVRVVNQQWALLNNQVKNVEGQLRQLSSINLGGLQVPGLGELLSIGNKFTQITAAVTAAVTTLQELGRVVGLVVQRAGQVAQLQLTFQTFGVSVEESNRLINDAKAISLSYGVSLAAVEKGFKRLTPAIIANGGTTAEVSEIIDALSARIVSLGLNTDESNRFIEAYAQVLGKGRLQAEELNQQFSELDGSLRSQVQEYVAATYGIQDFDEAMRKGQITADIFTEALLASSKTAQEQLAGALGEIQQRIDSLNPRQIQEITNTLNAISLENLARTFGDFGKQIGALGVFISQFFASITSDFPLINEFLAFVLETVGGALFAAITGIANSITLVLYIVEGIFQIIVKIVESVTGWANSIGFLRDAIQGIANTWNSLPQAVRLLISPITELSNLTKGQKSTVDGVNNSYASQLDQMYNIERQVKARQQAELAGLSTAERALMQQQEQLTVEKERAAQAKNRWDIEKVNIQENIEKLKERKETEVQGIKDAIEFQKDSHDQRMSQLDAELARLKEQKEEVRSRYAEELAALDKRSPQEERLLQIRREELQIRANNTQLSEKERLEAQVALQEIDKRLQRERIQAQEKRETLEVDKKISALEKEKADATEKNKRAIEALNDQLKSTEQNYQKQITALEQQIKSKDVQFAKEKDILTERQAQLTAAQESIVAGGTLNNVLDGTVSRTNAAAKNAERLRIELEKAAKVPVKGNNNFAGGPVKGGTTYTVNELGKEAFLSASGKLSMINAPAWGQWKAPATGTIIPAHLASQLDIPKGGINLNTIRTSDTVTSTTGLSRSYTRSTTSGDNIINNVTIQSDNPVQAASDMLVNLVRSRRGRRY